MENHGGVIAALATGTVGRGHAHNEDEVRVAADTVAVAEAMRARRAVGRRRGRPGR